MFTKNQLKTAILAVGIVAVANRIPQTRRLIRG